MSKYFIICDMQNINVKGSFGNQDAEKIIAGIVKKAKEMKAAGYTVIATRISDRESWKTITGKEQLIQTDLLSEEEINQKENEAMDVIEEIKSVTDIYLNKQDLIYNTWSSALETMLSFDMEFVNEVPVKVSDVHICGTRTCSSVLGNFITLKCAFPKIRITVHEDLCTCDSEETHDAALKIMKQMGAVITNENVKAENKSGTENKGDILTSNWLLLN